MAQLTEAERRIVPWKAKCKTWASLSLYFALSIPLVFSRLFLRFSVYFPVICGFSIAIHIRIHHYFSSSFLSVS